MNSFKTPFLVIIGMFVIYGCNNAVNGKVTGGGTIVSASGSGKANFGFNADSCSGKVKGKFNFHDKYFHQNKGGVKMNGTVNKADHCVGSGSGSGATRYNSMCGQCAGGYLVSLNYKSTNPKMKGQGAAMSCVKDNGQGMKATNSDSIWVQVTSGPYAGYKSSGKVQGNIKGHPCD